MFIYLNLIVHAIATFAMTGIIWFVSLVHYPVLKSLPKKQVTMFETEHWNRTMHLAVPMLLIELVSAFLLLFYRPVGVSVLLPSVGLVLLAVIWFSTWFVCVPCHVHLKNQYHDKYVTQLLSANLFRAVVWSLRSILVAMILYASLTTSFL
jgi:hypothetical protein